MIRTNDLAVEYSNSTRRAFEDLDLATNQHCLILGNSGSGKTTMLHLLGGLLKPSSGRVEIDGTEISNLNQQELDHFRGQNIGFIFQKPHLIQALNVEDNLYLAQFLAGKVRDRERVNQVLKHLNIEDKRRSKIYELSEGQAQRVVIARAVINKPSLILADEPTSSLDDENCEKVINILEEQAEENQSTLVIATHDLRLKELIPNHINPVKG